MNSLYNFTLLLHSWNRWIILIAGLLTIIFAIGGLLNKSDYKKNDRLISLIFISSLHLQLLIGILLYFVLSPITLQALSDFGAAMKENTIRYWAVEHSLVNLMAIAIAQVGSILVKRKLTNRAKFKSTLIWNIIALVLILAMIPMGMMGVDRPWFRI
ncbi:MAG: hypothetical protein RBS07_03175 [Lentimicrobium sp.]|jgi:type VI protein secretion system component VasK|nr:hypothetical protein [Lentimicrobium sp.]